jgi:tetratricopeptide (TPR) repeat protein
MVNGEKMGGAIRSFLDLLLDFRTGAPMRVALSASLLVLLGLGTLLPAQPQEGKKKPTAETVTAAQVRAHVGNALKDRKRQEELAELRTKVVLGNKKLRYEKKGERYLCTWEVRRKRGVKLSPAEWREVQEQVKAWLEQKINQFRGGLLSSGYNKIDFVVELAPATGTGSGTEDRTRLPAPTPEPRAQAGAAGWYYMPAPCGSCGPGWFFRVEGASATARAAAPARPLAAARARSAAANLATVSTQQQQSAQVGQRPGPRTLELPPLRTERLTAQAAPALFWQGYGLYWQREYAGALTYFEAATRLAADDARNWYYRALAERALGNHVAARKSRQRAVELHDQGKPRADVIGLALERVQGPLRQWLREGDEGGTRRLVQR